MQNKRFIKIIESTNGLVSASIFNLNTRKRQDLEFFLCQIWGIERRLQKAHEWADERIKVLEKYTQDDPRLVEPRQYWDFEGQKP